MLFGHGPTKDTFEARSFGTVNEAVYQNLQKTQSFIEASNKAASQSSAFHTKPAPVVQPQVSMPEACAQNLSGLKPRSYNEFTKKFDNNSQKLKLRA